MVKFSAFQTVPIAVKATRLFLDGWYDIGGAPKRCPAGTWLVELAHPAKGQKVHRFCLPDDVFREAYRPTDSESEAVWKERTDKIHPVWPDGNPIELT